MWVLKNICVLLNAYSTCPDTYFFDLFDLSQRSEKQSLIQMRMSVKCWLSMVCHLNNYKWENLIMRDWLSILHCKTTELLQVKKKKMQFQISVGFSLFDRKESNDDRETRILVCLGVPTRVASFTPAKTFLSMSFADG